jgi:hypothetical protein
MKKVQDEANLQREEAKRLMLKHFCIRSNESNGDIERIVDCIISASILESMLIINEGMRKNEANMATTDNP